MSITNIAFDDKAVTTAVPLPVVGGTGSTADQVQGNVASSATDSGNPVKVAGVFNTTPPTYTNGQRGDVQIGARGAVNVTLFGEGGTASPSVNTSQADALSAATNSIAVASFPKVYNGATWDRQKKPTATSRIVSAAASTNATVAKASAGDVFTVTAYNAAASVRYLKFYNKATAPTVGTDTPVLTIALQPTAALNVNLQSQYFSTGIAYALTTGAADADTGALTLADIVGLNITYQ